MLLAADAENAFQPTRRLAKRLGAPMLLATTGAILFALNGTFAWLGNAVLNPIAFLPMLVLGIEMIYDSVQGSKRKGWYVAAIALALSMYAGFPEVAYFDGLFCAGWAAVRFFDLPKESRLLAAKRVGLAGGVGLVLSLPILVPFYDFMKVAYVGSHTAAIAGVSKLSLRSVPMFFDPYIYGPIFRNPNALGPWGAVGGYFLASVTALALLGLSATAATAEAATSAKKKSSQHTAQTTPKTVCPPWVRMASRQSVPSSPACRFWATQETPCPRSV